MCMVLALGRPSPWGPHGGHMYHMNDFESPAPKDDSCQVCLKIQPCIFQEVDENNYFLHRGPLPQPVTPHGGPLGPPWEMPTKQSLFFT